MSKQSMDKKTNAEARLKKYTIMETLGKGTFGKVKLGIYKPNNTQVAIKILEKDRMVEEDDKKRVKREMNIIQKFTHHNVIQIYEIIETNTSYYIIMEYCEGGELFNYIVNNERLSDEEASFFYYQIINGIEYIHSKGVVHRDLKPENLLLSKNNQLKIIDFGLSNYFTDKLLSTPCGSPCYASPEMISGHKYNGFKIDIWSSGIILYAMLCGYLPFEDKDNDVLFQMILNGEVEYPNALSYDSVDLIKRILVDDPERRITIDEIKRHSFYLQGEIIYKKKMKDIIVKDYIAIRSQSYKEKKKMDKKDDLLQYFPIQTELELKKNKKVYSSIDKKKSKVFNVHQTEYIEQKYKYIPKRYLTKTVPINKNKFIYSSNLPSKKEHSQDKMITKLYQNSNFLLNKANSNQSKSKVIIKGINLNKLLTLNSLKILNHPPSSNRYSSTSKRLTTITQTKTINNQKKHISEAVKNTNIFKNSVKKKKQKSNMKYKINLNNQYNDRVYLQTTRSLKANHNLTLVQSLLMPKKDINEKKRIVHQKYFTNLCNTDNSKVQKKNKENNNPRVVFNFVNSKHAFYLNTDSNLSIMNRSKGNFRRPPIMANRNGSQRKGKMDFRK